jgi:flagellar hook assembly protein FlgD
VLAADPPAAAESAGWLAAAAPNPFATVTTIRYALATAGTMELAIYDIAGRRVARLAGGAVAAGEYSARWDGRDGAGQRVPAGIYLCRLRTPASSETRRIVVTE